MTDKVEQLAEELRLAVKAGNAMRNWLNKESSNFAIYKPEMESLVRKWDRARGSVD